MKLLKDNGFFFCPGCASRELHFEMKNLRCKDCGFVYFQNPAAAVGVIISREQQTEILLAVRARDPGRGYYDLPGGFVDPGESLEQALVRELAEELGPQISGHLSTPVYLLSSHNNYPYKQKMYPVCDVFFSTELLSEVALVAADDVESFVWCGLDEIRFEHVAFPSVREALSSWLQTRKGMAG